ncbi:MAG: hypothetical protein ACOY9J_05215 [Pseudomonadota bacterium]
MQPNIHFQKMYSPRNIANRIGACGNLLRQVPLALAMAIALIAIAASAEAAAVNPDKKHNTSISNVYAGNDSAQSTQGDARTRASLAKASRHLQRAANDLHNAMADFQKFLTPDQHASGNLVAISE